MVRDLYRGDCLELMREIPAGSVDMVLADLPFGTTRNAWDKAISTPPPMGKSVKDLQG